MKAKSNARESKVWLVCQYCRMAKSDVRERQDPYKADVCNDSKATHVACDKCDQERTDDT